MSWRRQPLRQVAPPIPSGLHFSPEEPVWHLNLDEIESHTGRVINKKVAPASEAGNSTYSFDDGNVLYSKLRPYLNKVVRPNEPGIATTELVPLRPVPGVLEPEFLAYYLRSPEFLGFAQSCVAGAKMPRVIMSRLWQTLIPVPPPSEQRRIVRILDQAEQSRRKRSKADALVERVTPALFLKMFGNPFTNPRNWPMKQLGDPLIGVLDRGRSQHRPRNAPHLYGGPYPFIQTGDIANSAGVIRRYSQTYSEHGLAQSRIWPAGTLCVTIAANIAKTGILAFDACFPDSVVGFVPGKGVTTEYVQIWLGFIEQQLDQLAPQMAQKNINLEILRRLRIPTPPIDLQCDFSRRVRALREVHSRAELSESKFGSLFQTLTIHAFSGILTKVWRDSHASQLQVEIEEQARILDRNQVGNLTTA